MHRISIDFKSEKTKTMILVILLFLFSAVIYFNFLLIPQIGRVVKIVVKANKMKADLKSAQIDITNIEKLKKNLEAYKEKIDRYEKMLPSEQEIPSLLENLSEMAKNSNVKIVAITPMVTKEKAKKDQAYKEMPIIVNAKSGYHELGSFLSDLESSGRFMKVEDIEIKSDPSAPKKHDAELLVLTYILLR